MIAGIFAPLPNPQSAGKAVVLGHAGYIQIFDYDCLEPPSQAGRQLMRCIPANVRQTRMQLG
jgi:ABC-type antimicrobial peptide transport system ATPase subunit